MQVLKCGRQQAPFMASAVLLAWTALSPVRLHAQNRWPGTGGIEQERCTDATGDGTGWLRRADAATGLADLHGAVQFEASEMEFQAYQSDRMSPPYLGSVTTYRLAFDPGSGAERATVTDWGARHGFDLVRLPNAAFVVRDSALTPVPSAAGFFGGAFEMSRPLNPLSVLVDWREARPRIVAHCTFRDFPRVVLSRGVDGERLYLDAKTAMPVKYERVEPHDLWGQVRAEYVYTTWWQAGPVLLPYAAARYMDGVEQLRRDLRQLTSATDTLAAVVDLRAVLPSPLPSPMPDRRATVGALGTPVPVDTIPVGPNTYLLHTRIYTHAVTLARDTIFLFDATTAEWRSRADSALIAQLFPGRHPMVLVVTDLAWPHVAGVRFWAARGAAIATHRISRPFLEQVLARRWTLHPDTWERSRVPVRWQLIDSVQTRAGGEVRLSTIDGISSEGALMGMIDQAGMLWAGDYIQSSATPTVYAREVMTAVSRAGFSPVRVAAEHLPLTPWNDILRVNQMP